MFLKHIDTGARIARADPNAILVFSGGQTNKSAGPLSEGQSYWHLAVALNALIPDASGDTLDDRMITEEYARDSYENLLFSIARFYEYTGNYPTSITIVGHAFKQQRFEELHRAAIDYPASQFHYVGINPASLADNPEFVRVTKAEEQNAVIPFKSDPHGCSNTILVAKRKSRNPFRRSHPYSMSNPQLYRLLTICGGQKALGPQEMPLPWTEKSPTKSSTASEVADEDLPVVSSEPTKENSDTTGK